MTLEELMSLLSRAIKSGRLDPEREVMMRDLSVSDDAIEAGSSGHIELSAVLVVDGQAFLVPEE